MQKTQGKTFCVVSKKKTKDRHLYVVKKFCCFLPIAQQTYSFCLRLKSLLFVFGQPTKPVLEIPAFVFWCSLHNKHFFCLIVNLFSAEGQDCNIYFWISR